jgi:hypothetical protein
MRGKLHECRPGFT